MTASSAFQSCIALAAASRVDDRHSSAASGSDTHLRALRIISKPSKWVNALAIISVTCPRGSFLDQHSTTRNFESEGSGIFVATFVTYRKACCGDGIISFHAVFNVPFSQTLPMAISNATTHATRRLASPTTILTIDNRLVFPSTLTLDTGIAVSRLVLSACGLLRDLWFLARFRSFRPILRLLPLMTALTSPSPHWTRVGLPLVRSLGKDCLE